MVVMPIPMPVMQNTTFYSDRACTGTRTGALDMCTAMSNARFGRHAKNSASVRIGILLLVLNRWGDSVNSK